MNNIADTLLEQAPKTAKTYLNESVLVIDKAFGSGYAKANPELVGAFMQTAALDYLAGILEAKGQAIASCLDTISANAAFPPHDQKPKTA